MNKWKMNFVLFSYLFLVFCAEKFCLFITRAILKIIGKNIEKKTYTLNTFILSKEIIESNEFYIPNKWMLIYQKKISFAEYIFMAKFINWLNLKSHWLKARREFWFEFHLI